MKRSYRFTLNAFAIITPKDNITGVSMGLDPVKQLDVISKAFPARKKIGVIYRPRSTGHIVDKARKAAGKAGIDLIIREIGTMAADRDIKSRFVEMLGKIDIYWEIPDGIILRRPHLPFLFHALCKKMRVPMITFNETVLNQRGLMSINEDYFAVGRQVGEMANKIFKGMRPGDIPRADPCSGVITVNVYESEHFFIKIDDRITPKGWRFGYLRPEIWHP